MQLFPIFLIAVVLAGHQSLVLSETFFDVTPRASAAIAWLPMLAILALTWIGVSWCVRGIERSGSTRLIARAERITHYSRWLILLNHAAAVLAFGWLHTVRDWVGDLILVDELIVILPPVIGLLATWWIYYPVERRLRESLTLRRLDEGLTIHPIPSRLRYIDVQMRMGLLLLLVPILMIVGLAEAIRMAATELPWAWVDRAAEGGTLVAAAGVFLVAPLIARVLLHVKPLAHGELRDDLLVICHRHTVRVRDLLLWNTSGSMINAAVMGLHGRLRYVLITDALIEVMARQQLRAVMAHEVGHVRRRHLPWLLGALLAALVLAQILIEGPLRMAYSLGFPMLLHDGVMHHAMTGAFIAQLALGLWVFGWVSRRFERQADTFAVQHLSEHTQDGQQCEAEPCSTTECEAKALCDPTSPDSCRVTSSSVAAMTGALDRIAQLNAIDPNRHSWRHGSIAWRVDYLHSIVGMQTNQLPIDRIVARIKVGSGVVLMLAGVALVWLWWSGV